MEYTKGETAGGWIYILGSNGMPVALVHPKHIDKFIAAPDLYKALETLIQSIDDEYGLAASQQDGYIEGCQALAKARVK